MFKFINLDTRTISMDVILLSLLLNLNRPLSTGWFNLNHLQTILAWIMLLNCEILTHFSLMFNFSTPWKRQKTFSFLSFSGGTEIEHWDKTDWYKWCNYVVIEIYYGTKTPMTLRRFQPRNSHMPQQLPNLLTVKLKLTF